MKKLFYIAGLSSIILTACSEDKAMSKEEAPASEHKDIKEKTVNSYTDDFSDKSTINDSNDSPYEE